MNIPSAFAMKIAGNNLHNMVTYTQQNIRARELCENGIFQYLCGG